MLAALGERFNNHGVLSRRPWSIIFIVGQSEQTKHRFFYMTIVLISYYCQTPIFCVSCAMCVFMLCGAIAHALLAVRDMSFFPSRREICTELVFVWPASLLCLTGTLLGVSLLMLSYMTSFSPKNKYPQLVSNTRSGRGMRCDEAPIL